MLSLRLEHVDVGLNSTLELGVGKTTPTPACLVQQCNSRRVGQA